MLAISPAVEAAHDSLRVTVYKKAALRFIPFLCLCLVAAYLDRVNVGFAKLQMLDDLSFSNTVYGLGAGIFFLGYVLFEVPSNILLHKVGARIWIARIMLSWGVIATAMAFVQTPVQFYVVRFLLGVAEAGFMPGVFYFLSCWFPSDRRGRILALLLSAVPLSSVIGGPLSGWIMSSFTDVGGFRAWQWLFLLETIPSLVLGYLAIKILINSPSDAAWLSEEEKSIISEDLAREAARKQEHSSFASAFRSVVVWQLSLAYFCIVSAMYVIIFWMPTLIKQHGVTDVMQIGWLTTIPYLTAIVAMYFCNASADRHGERRWHTAIPCLLTASGLALSAMHFDSLALTMCALTLAAASASMAQSAFWSMPPSFLTGAAAAAGMALINSLGNISGMASTAAVGWITDQTGNPQLSLFLISALAVLGAILILRLPAKLVNH
jgi:D-galactonate transporter